MPKNQLSTEDIRALHEARNVIKAGASAGVNLDEAPKTTGVPLYDTFIPIDNLPSGGSFYSSVISGQPLKVEDLLLIQTITDTQFQRSFSEIFARRIQGVAPSEILVADEIYLALWLRANSYPGYNFPHDGFKCTNTECEADVPPGAVDFGFMDMDFSDSNLPNVRQAFGNGSEVELTLKEGTRIKLTMKRRKHTARVQSVLKRDYYDYNRQPPPTVVYLLNIASVINFDENLSDLVDIADRIHKLSPVEYSDLHRQIKKYTLTGEPIMQLKCPVCGEVTRFSGYIFRPDIYIPTDNG